MPPCQRGNQRGIFWKHNPPAFHATSPLELQPSLLGVNLSLLPFLKEASLRQYLFPNPRVCLAINYYEFSIFNRRDGQNSLKSFARFGSFSRENARNGTGTKYSKYFLEYGGFFAGNPSITKNFKYSRNRPCEWFFHDDTRSCLSGGSYYFDWVLEACVRRTQI